MAFMLLPHIGLCSDFPGWLSINESNEYPGRISHGHFRYDYYLMSDSTAIQYKPGVFESQLFLNDSVAKEFIEADYDYGYVKLKNEKPQKIASQNVGSFIHDNRDSLEEIRW